MEDGEAAAAPEADGEKKQPPPPTDEKTVVDEEGQKSVEKGGETAEPAKEKQPPPTPTPTAAVEQMTEAEVKQAKAMCVFYEIIKIFKKMQK